MKTSLPNEDVTDVAWVPDWCPGQLFLAQPWYREERGCFIELRPCSIDGEVFMKLDKNRGVAFEHPKFTVDEGEVLMFLCFRSIVNILVQTQETTSSATTRTLSNTGRMQYPIFLVGDKIGYYAGAFDDFVFLDGAPASPAWLDTQRYTSHPLSSATAIKPPSAATQLAQTLPAGARRASIHDAAMEYAAKKSLKFKGK